MHKRREEGQGARVEGRESGGKKGKGRASDGGQVSARAAWGADHASEPRTKKLLMAPPVSITTMSLSIWSGVAFSTSALTSWRMLSCDCDSP